MKLFTLQPAAAGFITTSTLTSSVRGNRATVLERLDLFRLRKQDSAASDLQTANACEHILRWSERNRFRSISQFFFFLPNAIANGSQPFPDMQCGHGLRAITMHGTVSGRPIVCPLLNGAQSIFMQASASRRAGRLR